MPLYSGINLPNINMKFNNKDEAYSFLEKAKQIIPTLELKIVESKGKKMNNYVFMVGPEDSEDNLSAVENAKV